MSNNSFTHNQSKGLPLLPLLGIVFLILIELFAFFAKGSAARFAAIFWLLQWSIICFAIFKIWGETLIKEIESHRYAWPAFQITSIFLMTVVCGRLNLTDLNYESGLQVASGLNSLSSLDFSYFSTGFLGYGARQYLINALPSYFFGRTTFLLHFGFALPFIIGFLSLSVGFKILNDKLKCSESLALLPIILLLTIPSVPEIYLVFEQTISPLSASMTLLGLAMIFLIKRNFIYFFGLVWFGGLLCFSYTPSLVFVAFSLACSLFILFGVSGKITKETKDVIDFNAKLYALANIIYISIFLIFSWVSRQDRPSGVAENLQLADALQALWVASFGTGYGFGALGAYGLFGLLTAPILIVCLLNISKFKEKPYLALMAVFVILTPIAAVILRGYTSYELGLSAIRRSLVVIPLAIVLIYFAIIQWRDGAAKIAFPVILFFIAFAASSLFGTNKYIPFLNASRSLQFAIDDNFSNINDFRRKQNLILYVPKDFGVVNSYDYLNYYAPNHKTYQLTDFEIPAEINKSENLTLMTYGYAELPPLPEGWTARKVIHRDARRQEDFSYFLLSANSMGEVLPKNAPKPTGL